MSSVLYFPGFRGWVVVTQPVHVDVCLIVYNRVWTDLWPWTTKQFFQIEIYTSSESWINKLSIDACNIEKIAFIVVQMKFLVMHIIIIIISFYIFTVGNFQNF